MLKSLIKQLNWLCLVCLMLLSGRTFASNIIIRSYNHSNIVVETKNFTSNPSDKIVLENVDREVDGVKIYEITDGNKVLLFDGDVRVKRNQAAEAIAFPYNMLLIKELNDEAPVSPSLKTANLEDVNTVLTQLKGKRNEANRLDIFKNILKQYSFSSAQLAVILSSFTFEEIKASAAIMSYDNVQDKKNFMRLYYLLMNAPADNSDALID